MGTTSYLSIFPVIVFKLRTFPLIHYLARHVWVPSCTPVSMAKRQQFPWPAYNIYHPDLVAEIFKMWFQALEFVVASYCSQVYFLLLYKERELELVFQKLHLLFPLAPTVKTRATELRFLSRCPRWHLAPCYCKQLLCSWIEQLKSNGAHSTLTAVAAELCMRYQIIKELVRVRTTSCSFHSS